MTLCPLPYGVHRPELASVQAKLVLRGRLSDLPTEDDRSQRCSVEIAIFVDEPDRLIHRGLRTENGHLGKNPKLTTLYKRSRRWGGHTLLGVIHPLVHKHLARVERHEHLDVSVPARIEVSLFPLSAKREAALVYR